MSPNIYTLVIPDLHHHTENAERWLHNQQFDRVIFLGDYFDDFGDNVNDARRTATWLRQRMDQTEDVFLLGNHDAAYMFPDNGALYCPGFTKAKARGIHEILRPEHWRRFRLAVVEHGWLLSHAGFHPTFVPGLDPNAITAVAAWALRDAAKGVIDPMLGMGLDRNGSQPVGGVLWMDRDSLIPIPGIHQIIGHTPGQSVREKITPESRNCCLDVRNGAAAALIDSNEITILTS